MFSRFSIVVIIVILYFISLFVILSGNSFKRCKYFMLCNCLWYLSYALFILIVSCLVNTLVTLFTIARLFNHVAFRIMEWVTLYACWGVDRNSSNYKYSGVVHWLWLLWSAIVICNKSVYIYFAVSVLSKSVMLSCVANWVDSGALCSIVYFILRFIMVSVSSNKFNVWRLAKVILGSLFLFYVFVIGSSTIIDDINEVRRVIQRKQSSLNYSERVR